MASETPPIGRAGVVNFLRLRLFKSNDTCRESEQKNQSEIDFMLFVILRCTKENEPLGYELL